MATRKRGPRKQNTETASSDCLRAYRDKRRFERTPEPAPRESSQAARAREEKKTALRFVVHKHDAHRLHYDVRLEVDGAMASWAVPKGPSYDPSVKRLAVRTEDHPIEYNDFEGRIPEGEYGAGDVLVWDRGTYETVPAGRERAMLDKGHMHVALFGEKLIGEWHLVRTRQAWLMFKARDAHADPTHDVVAERPDSVVSGRAATRGPRRVGASEQGKSARALFDAVGDVALATPTKTLPEPEQWLFEVKYDGYRVVACKAGRDVRLYTRNRNDWTDRFPPIADAVRNIAAARECVIDGEACVVDESGRPSFGALQEWIAGRVEGALLGYAAFDLLWLDGRDLRREPIERRRELLEKLVEGVGGALSFSRAVAGDVAKILAAAKRAGLEGLVAKRKGSPYVAGRSTTWLKLRFDRRQDCAIVGWIRMAGTRDQVGALLLGVVVEGKFVYAGRVGTGFDDRMRRDLARRLSADEVAEARVEGAPRTKDARYCWVEPKLACECAFTEWTRSGSMRQPRLLGLREDKSPTECVRVEDEKIEAPPPPPSQPPRRAAPKLANPQKILFPRDGITKRDVWDYYTAIAPLLLPHLADRPIAFQRWPDGIDGEEWYQQHAPEGTPGFVRWIDVGDRHGKSSARSREARERTPPAASKRIVCDDVQTLQWLANLAALTLHQWSSREPTLALPDYVVLDLDPGDGPWSHLVEVATAVRALLGALHLESVVKTSGKRGVHVVVPIAHGPTHRQAAAFAEQVARAVAKVLPHVSTVERMTDKRGGRLYIDYGQNGEGRTIAAPYTIRARDGAVVSTPIAWDELTGELDPAKFTIETVLARVAKKGDLFAAACRPSRQRLPGADLCLISPRALDRRAIRG